MARKLPPFAALRAFEAAARHCNLRHAADELCLSVSAISHQVKSLEQFLGVRVFDRTHNTLTLTEVGHKYLQDIAHALDAIAAATARAEVERVSSQVAISLFPSLAVLWLMPSLPKFYQQAPHIDITIVTSVEPPASRVAATDLVIRYEPVAELRSNAQVLFREHMYPVCSSKYAQEIGLADPSFSFDDVTFIHCQTAPEEWRQWFAGTGGARTPTGRVVNVDNRALALQAAESGLGLAMGLSLIHI